MKQFYYVIQTIFRGKSSNLTKVISLTLGIFVGILLFACVAFQLNFYSFLRQPEQLYLTHIVNVLNGVKGDAFPYTYGTLSEAIRENFPKEVEDATVLREMGRSVYYNGSVRLQERKIFADEHLFSTLGLRIIVGNPEDLLNPHMIFISETLAKKIVEDGKTESAIGKVLYANRKDALTVRGVFEDMGENTDIAFDVVESMVKLWDNKRAGWGFDISYTSIIRFKNPTTDALGVEARLPQMLKKYMPDFNKESNNRFEFSFRPLQELHTSSPIVRTMLVVMSVLAISVLLIAAFNYVLISISSLPRRAKAIGVHKCSGATDGSVFRMFLMETALIMTLSCVLVVGLLFQFRGFVEEVTAASLSSLFTIQTLWIPALVILIVFLLAGVIPAIIFTSVPVTQVFRHYSERKTAWKRPLLFIQFMGMTFILGFLIVVLYQYDTIMNRDLGYNPDRMVTCWFSFGNEQDNARNFFSNLPMVESYGAASQEICKGYSGDTFVVGEGRKVNVRMDWVNKNFVPLMEIEILQGKNISSENQVLVNEEFVRQAHWTDHPVGKQIYHHYDGATTLTVTGVVKNFAIRSAYEPQEPVMLIFTSRDTYHYLRLKEPFQENLMKLNEMMKSSFPSDDVVFVSLRKNLDDQYVDIVRFRDAVWLASVSIFLIAIMGLLGYVSDEVRRRSKEIAIRKVNGAEASSILKLLSVDILWTALPGVIIGSVSSWCMGNKWLDQFAEVIPLSASWFIGVALIVLTVIFTTVILKAWHIANENPVKSIKSE